VPRRPRVVTEDLVFHVYNRAIQSTTLFAHPNDYDLFLGVIREALQRVPIRLLAYVLMPNHWHLVLWPRRGQLLADLMKWATGTHVQWYRMITGTRGRGALYQGRYKAIPVETDTYFYNLIRYVERNPLRKGLVRDVRSWRWSSAWPRPAADHPPLSEWPVPVPADWEARLCEREDGSELDEIRTAIRRSIPYGRPAWQKAVVKRLGWRTGLERPGRRWPQKGLSSAPDSTAVPELHSEQ
jgi:putative transposase